ncbi:restriction endonuclease subunit M [Enemella dayhoffiae]|uniref:site-specific DNA-methyltransferase (adenine-specific) n=1 Tax=Enemella dayhoffiae TaxID=2016507 RepID=A0A255H787_9ACTN|nr:DNA methyltransferase [Enemella dayhoffiae]OYO23441.1 restriction endonuclease subunit M [Enemella dayhoffiae]
MASSDALVVVEDWISEHYFSTDATKESFAARVIARRKEWDAEESSVRTRFVGARNQLGLDLAALYAEDATDPALATEVQDDLLRVLGYREGAWTTATEGPITRVSSPGLDDAASSLAIIRSRPLQTVEQVFAKDEETLDPTTVGDQSFTSVGRLLSSLFVDDDSPGWALVMGGRWLVVAEKGRWAEGRCLGIDIQTVADRNDTKRGGEIDRALTCLEAPSLAPDADGAIWWDGTLEDSVKHTVGVSKDLREGVRLSIEIIANDVVERRAAKGLPPLGADEAQPLAIEALRYLYRILFLLYAEASPEMGVLPAGDDAYDQGYSLDRLRDLVLVTLSTPQALAGTHFHDSLGVLFRLVDQGHDGGLRDEDAEREGTDGLTFHGLRADLFKPEAIRRIDEVGLSNQALQRVLQKLLLSKESRGRDRGFISYVDLGINQLGAVYEGLMSYTGSFATEDLYEVAPGGNPEKGSWVVPIDRADDLGDEHFVRTENPDTGEWERVVHRRGTFVFRLSGRDRQQSASFYTPEVLTRFTVGQALEELLDQDGHTTTAEEILSLTICEPALGSGAFAIEGVRQLAEQYLRRRQEELGTQVDADERPQVLQRIKAHIALHQVYGVDLNATAVELAEISLWLDTMAAGLQAPWFGLRLRRGNSLIGAKHAVYTVDEVKKKQWLTAAPADVPLANLVAAAGEDSPHVSGVEGRIHHFLLPAEGWGATAEAKEAKALVPDAVKRVRDWSKSLRRAPSTQQIKRLVALSERVEVLWQYAWRRLTIAERESRRAIELWGDRRTEAERHAGGVPVTREQIEESLANPDGAYRRLRLVMDAWCALWFWPLVGTEGAEPPTLDAWLDALEGILGRPVQSSTRDRAAARAGQAVLSGGDWEALGEAEALDLSFAGAQPVARVMAKSPWLRVAQQVAERQGFFHWELDFATVFGRGGFDLQVGNPPWVRPDTDVDVFLADFDPWWVLAHKPSEAQRQARRLRTLDRRGAQDKVTDDASSVVAVREFVGAPTNYPVLTGLRPDLYRCFMAQAWDHMSRNGVAALIHPDSHFVDEKANRLRRETYQRLRRHWQFVNELQLFEVHHLVTYGVHTYGSRRSPRFLNASTLYHPDTVERSLRHSGDGPSPGFKDDDGRWDLRPHAQRIVTVTENELAVWRDVLESDEVPAADTRMLYTVNSDVAAVLTKLANAPRISSLGLHFSQGWNETTDRQRGRFEQRWGAPESWQDVILQGPHLHVNNPAYKVPNPTMKHNQDWSEVDLETLALDAIPVTAYKPAGDRSVYDAQYGTWNGKPVRDHYRVAWRAMAANTGERTMIPAIIPPGSAHPNGVFAMGGAGAHQIVKVQAFAGSLLADFAVRAAPKSGIYAGVFGRLPYVPSHPLDDALVLRCLRLNAITAAYVTLWHQAWRPSMAREPWVLWRGSEALGTGPVWSPDTPLRLALTRRDALVELDALVAVMLGISADELCTVYRTQFAVLRGYDQNTYLYDKNARLVPSRVLQIWRKKGDAISIEDRTHTNAAGNTYVYELPFTAYDREADMRTAHAEFTRRLRETEG